MRIAVCGLIMAALAQQALAGDAPFPILRGTQTYEIASPAYFRWEGVYVGGQVGANSAHMDFKDATKSITAFALRQSTLESEQKISEWPVLGSVDTRGGSFGGFIGYNAQWEDVVLGVEGNYNHTALSANTADNLVRVVGTSDGVGYTTRVTGSASMRIQDYATLRGRAGWAAGRFLPYAMIGFGFGVADVQRSVFVDGIVQPPSGSSFPFGPWGGTESKKAFIYGYSGGFGLDVALTSRIFLRGEYEYAKFSPIMGITASLNSARFGGGLKF